MIFVTVGSQLPFDRLIRAVDEIAPSLGMPVFAQVGRSEYVPNSITSESVLAPSEFERQFRAADIVIGHAGVGTVLQARSFGKRLIICPRKAALGEHRNDHQLATARELVGMPGVRVAHSGEEIRDAVLDPNFLSAAQAGDSRELSALIVALRRLPA